MEVPKRILLIQLKQRGDILMSTPCCKIIKDQCPDAFLGFFSYEMGRDVVEHNPYIDKTHYFNPAGGIRDELKLISEIKKQKYEAVIDFWNSNRGGLYGWLSGGKKRVSYKTKRQFFYTDLVDKKNDPVPQYSSLDKVRLLEKIGIDGSNSELMMPWKDSDATPVLNFINKNEKLHSSKFRVILSPTHRRSIRKWPLDNYVQLADEIIENFAAEIIWIWGPGEEKLIDQAINSCTHKTWKCPPLTFRQLAPLMANCQLFIGNSNGPSHVAVATGTPSLQIHGPTHASSWSPLTKPHQAIEVPADFKDKISIDSISTDDVWRRVLDMRNDSII